MATATTEVGAAACTSETSAVGARLAAVCDMIEEYRNAGTPISARRAAAISAMIDGVAATAAAEGKPRTRKQRMGSARWYQELCRLGEGAFGVVSKARHRATGQVVAVKSVRPARTGVFDLPREACFMAACRPSLAVPEADVRRIMRRLLPGAEAMHQHGIVHRHIKPENILYAAEKDPPHWIIGTIPYMAPEALLENPDYDTLVDSWSLGCVMAELLGDDVPFAGEDITGQL
uniref:[RNA-polymerase]-subunit kinase n=1 Tax=Setaria viridis TaxID=4556 RepID=A0A4U6VJL3_SETVI|nr:hypothetical protein SEVIR_3G311500v2 [Setaria viridis]